MIDQMPSNQYGPKVADYIQKLELVGEAFIEHYFLINAITDPFQLNLTFNDLENLKIQSLKYNKLDELALNFDLPKKMLTNEKVQGGRQREPYQVVRAIVGALSLWAGIEPSVHLLQILQIIVMRKPVVDLKQEEKKIQEKDQLGLIEQVNSFFDEEEEVKEKNHGSESNAKLHQPSQDEKLPTQVQQYLEKI